MPDKELEQLRQRARTILGSGRWWNGRRGPHRDAEQPPLEGDSLRRFHEGQQAVGVTEPTEWRVHRLDLGEGRFLHGQKGNLAIRQAQGTHSQPSFRMALARQLVSV